MFLRQGHKNLGIFDPNHFLISPEDCWNTHLLVARLLHSLDNNLDWGSLKPPIAFDIIISSSGTPVAQFTHMRYGYELCP